MVKYIILVLNNFSGPDPADPSRILIRKIVQCSEGTYGYEEVTVTKREGDKPSVHSKLVRLGDWDLNEEVSAQEHAIRVKHRPTPNVIAFSLYYRLT